MVSIPSVEEESKPKARGKVSSAEVVDITEPMAEPVAVGECPPVPMTIPVSAVTSKSKTNSATNKRTATSSIIESTIEQHAEMNLNPIFPLVDPCNPNKKRISEGPFTVDAAAIERKMSLRSSLSPQKENSKPVEVTNTVKARETTAKGTRPSASTQESYVLQVIEGPHRNYQHPLLVQSNKQKEITFAVGRDDDNDIALPSDESISGK